MSIAQQIMANPGRFSKAELQAALNQGVVPAYIAIPLIEEKTQKEKMMQMAMAGQGAPQEGAPTVAEEVLQQADQGLPGLESNLPEEEYNYAPGGIVAFAHGGAPGYASRGLVDEEDDFGFRIPQGMRERLDVATSPEAVFGSDYEQTREGISSLVSSPGEDDAVKAVNRFRRLTSGLPSTQAEDDAVRAALIKQAENAEANAKRAEGYRFLELAGAIGSSDQAYNPLAAISGGLKQVAPLFAQDEAAREKAGLENLLARSSLSRQAREQAMADITGGMGLYKTELEEKGREATANARVRAAQIAAAKDKITDYRTYVEDYVADALEKNPKASVAQLRRQAGDAYILAKQQPQFASVQQRGAAAIGEQDVQRAGIDQRRLDSSVDAVTKALDNPRSVEAREMKNIKNKYGPDAAIAYKRKLIQDYYNMPVGGAAPSPAPAPQASPAQSAIPDKAIGFLKANNDPSHRAAFDAKYGKGAAARALGG
jgi:hypothetical protein